ncbi:hypothetical protein COU89_02615 [Candidatus Roizmanbacteria bacterium CG10_big_fil_rev_8_21_14_0_10_45_7]|uniref:Uncharacterized protein n=1 Tax=Candidatus Roizmanbacteria bacterium CG10_big_fil_rev_8_21_14_0_10_45_7 TaxID=1974854 RepID=A0A2M8KUG6_9BACT|nr:MAG: hypothetical protein COU89_02615 [Candidatus Roizmanbacteria bacterium CG10_big_fil_rev_8_21_14_0_10_45_7]
MYGVTTDIIATSYSQIIGYLPSLFAGLVLVGVGFVAGALAQQVFRLLLRVISISRLPRLLGKSARDVSAVWMEIGSELILISFVILFLVPAFDAWRLPKLASLSNSVLLFLPNIFAAYFIFFAGYLGGRLIRITLEQHVGKGVAITAQGTVFTTAGLIALSQLGVAQDFIKLLFAGIVLFIALSAGIAFGLGGRDLAHDILVQLRKKIQRRHRLEA